VANKSTNYFQLFGLVLSGLILIPLLYLKVKMIIKGYLTIY